MQPSDNTVIVARYGKFRKHGSKFVSLAHDMSGSLAGEMSALGKRLGIHITSGGWRDGVFEDRNGAGDEGTGSDLASDQQADELVAGGGGVADEPAATASAVLAVPALWLRWTL